MRLLLIEDDAALSQVLTTGLTREGHEVVSAGTFSTGRRRALGPPFDVILLDVMLPGGSGLDLCRELRQRKVTTPILMLTARDGVADRVAGLDVGADDYLTKPFAPSELLACLRALARRQARHHGRPP